MSTRKCRHILLACTLSVCSISAQVSYQYIHCYDQGGYRTAVCPSGYLLTSCNGGVIDEANGNRCVPYSDHESPVLYARCCNLTTSDTSSDMADTVYTQYGTHPSINNSIYCQSPQQQMLGCTSSNFIGLYVNKQTFNADTQPTRLSCSLNHANAPNVSVSYASVRCYDAQNIDNDGYQLNCHAVWGETTHVQCPANYFLTSCHAYSSNPSAVSWYGVNDTTETCIATPAEGYAAESHSDDVVTANAICCSSTKDMTAEKTSNAESFIMQQSTIILSTLVSCCVMCALISLSVFVCQRNRHREQVQTDADRRVSSESGITDLGPTDFLKTSPRILPMSSAHLAMQNSSSQEGLSGYHASAKLVKKPSIQSHISELQLPEAAVRYMYNQDKSEDTIVIRISKHKR